MNLKKAKKVSDVLYMVLIGCVGLFFLFPQYRGWISVGVFLSLLIQFIFSFKFMRSPHCGKNVGRYDEVCKHCGRNVDAEPKIRNQKKKV